MQVLVEGVHGRVAHAAGRHPRLGSTAAVGAGASCVKLPPAAVGTGGALRWLVQLAPAAMSGAARCSAPRPSCYSCYTAREAGNPLGLIPAAGQLMAAATRLMFSFSSRCRLGVLLCSPAATFMSGNCRQAGRQAGRETGRQAGKVHAHSLLQPLVICAARASPSAALESTTDRPQAGRRVQPAHHLVHRLLSLREGGLLCAGDLLILGPSQVLAERSAAVGRHGGRWGGR